MTKESFSDFYDMIAYIILKAPNRFPTDYKMNLEIAFSELNDDLNKSKNELGKFYQEVKELVASSLSFYRTGDIRQGIKSLQTVENIIRENKLRK